MRTRVLEWTTGPPPAAPRALHLSWPQLLDRIAAARMQARSRSSLRNPASRLLAAYRRADHVVVSGFGCGVDGHLALLLGYVLEPAFRAGCRLTVVADRRWQDIDPAAAIEPAWGCPWTLERIRFLARAYATPADVAVPAPVPLWRRVLRRALGRGRAGPRPVPRLDQHQNAAVAAGDGVVQVIAPAGSGKTTVLVERVAELHRRGTAPERILCTTFNRDACSEMAARLDARGLGGVRVRSFHGLGLDILREAGRLRDRLGALEDSAWEELAAAAAAAEGEGGLDGAAARSAVSGFKLGAMVDPREALRRSAGGPPRARAASRVYALYEQHLETIGLLDFDDLVFRSVALLQRSARVRACWQARFERVLVDEYQDIEPAQALLVGLLAAPHDSLFCVGDEDQCIYAWRRASVERVLELDQVYPGLERYPLVRNYRCGKAITLASRRLISHNRRRFRKPLLPGSPERGAVRVRPASDLARGAAQAAALAMAGPPGRTAVLARTGRLLGMVRALLPDGAAVTLATVHAAKGREWDRVILFAADEGRFPHGQGLDADAVESERRLFYVALTRARLELEIVCSRGRPSRFLAEAGLRP